MKPHLLQGLGISGPDQVWCSDITYVPMASRFVYLVAVTEWGRLDVVAWELSNSLESECCICQFVGKVTHRFAG
jgi:putative transposase